MVRCVRNGDLLATKRHRVHKSLKVRFDRSSGLCLLRFFVARKNGKVREGAHSNSVGFRFASVAYRQSLLRCGLLRRRKNVPDDRNQAK